MFPGVPPPGAREIKGDNQTRCDPVETVLFFFRRMIDQQNFHRVPARVNLTKMKTGGRVHTRVRTRVPNLLNLVILGYVPEYHQSTYFDRYPGVIRVHTLHYHHHYHTLGNPSI